MRENEFDIIINPMNLTRNFKKEMEERNKANNCQFPINRVYDLERLFTQFLRSEKKELCISLTSCNFSVKYSKAIVKSNNNPNSVDTYEVF